MAIKGLTDRGMAFPQIGNIRKGGAKDPTKNMPGRDLKHFRVEFDAQEDEVARRFEATYGKEPQEINIVLPFNEIDRCWDAWCEAYTAGRMVARSDGEYFLYLSDVNTGEVIVQNGATASGQRVPHKELIGKAGKSDIKCRPVGRLKILLADMQRAAYLVVHTTSVIDIRNISEQLEAIKALNGGRIVGVPLVLRRRPKMISRPDPNSPGKKVRSEKWMLSIEADPRWVKAMFEALDRAALPAGTERLALPDMQPVEEELVDGDAEWTTDEGAPVDDYLPEEVSDEPTQEDAVTDKPPLRFTPTELHKKLHARAAKLTGKAGPEICQSLAPTLEAILGGEDQRHEFIRWFTDGRFDSLGLLTSGELLALHEWLKPAYNRAAKVFESTSPEAVAECTAAHTEWLKANGAQGELEL